MAGIRARTTAAAAAVVFAALALGGLLLVLALRHTLTGQVRTDLVDNAVRHAGSAVRLRLTARDGTVRLEVADDGPPIPPADRARIFERFARLDDARAREHGGAGLGLAIVAGIVAAHGGTIPVDAEDGWTRFLIELPAVRD